ncbi:MAG: TetR/AcrR family transcriptional regulator [Rubrivivax sp.]|nr:MAG: TetR/AcrR family transcriptional regulator [Rubrivivax sp.]
MARSRSIEKPPAPASVRERLLDAAEALFAEHGFHGAPMRDITAMASTRLANINDQFGSKEEFFQAVIARRAPLINADRLALLQAVRSSRSKTAEIRAVVEAFGQPLLVRSQESEGWRNYLRLLSQLTNSRSVVLLLIAQHFSPMAALFSERIGQVLPQLTPRQRMNAYQLMVSAAMAVFSDNRRIDVMSGGAESSSDFASHYEDMVSFTAGGILALAD